MNPHCEVVLEMSEDEYKAQCVGCQDPPTDMNIHELRWLKRGRAMGVVAFDGDMNVFFAFVMLPACACDKPCGPHFSGPLEVGFWTEETALAWLHDVLRISDEQMSLALKEHLARSN